MKDTLQDQLLFQKMTETKMPKLIGTLAIPTIISMLISAIYNTADTFFVSQLGTSASGAVGIVFSVMALIQSCGFMLGMGAGSQISRVLGAKEHEHANTLASSAFAASLVLGGIITILGLVFTTPLMKLLGATPTILPYASDYGRYIFLGAPLMCGSYVLNNLLRAEGKAAFSMVGITTGGILNIALDPLFIFTFKLGISGAAIATVLSQFISFLLLLSVFLRGKSAIKLRTRYLSRSFDIYQSIITVGFPSFARQGLASIATAMLNAQAAVYGDCAVAAMSIVGRLFMLVYSVIIGLGQGFQPVAGHNYGAKKYHRVIQAISFSVKVGTILLAGLSLILFIFAPQIMTAFRADDAQVIAIGTFSMRIQCLSMLFMPFYTITSMTFQVIGRSGPATILSTARQGIFFLPLLLVLPQVLGLQGVQIAQPIADFASFALSLYFMIPLIKELRAFTTKEDLQNEL